MALVAASLAPPARAQAPGPAVTLGVTPSVVTYGQRVVFSGAVTPAASVPVAVLRQASASVVASGVAAPDGSYALATRIRTPGAFVARAAGATSPAVAVRVRPLMAARFEGLRILGAPLHLAGSVRPATAGRVELSIQGRVRSVRLDGSGRFRVRIASRRAGRVCAAASVRPAPGFATQRISRCTRILTPTLVLGSRGEAVRYLEAALMKRHYALLGVDATFGADTRDAVYAFEKVERLGRDGAAGPQVWRALLTARTPRAAGGGSHLEVDKARQVLFEVRGGKVFSVAHVSTGATGNTPVGHWRVYRKEAGYNAKGMYDSLYFLRGFAVHGYASVPPYPASHGCVRVPLWLAPRIFARWPLGSWVWVR